MHKEIESVVLHNKHGQQLRIYKVENSSDEFCIGLDGHQDHFIFKYSEYENITNAIVEVCESCPPTQK